MGTRPLAMAIWGIFTAATASGDLARLEEDVLPARQVGPHRVFDPAVQYASPAHLEITSVGFVDVRAYERPVLGESEAAGVDLPSWALALDRAVLLDVDAPVYDIEALIHWEERPVPPAFGRIDFGDDASMSGVTIVAN